ncbi:ATP-binding protein [Kiloniella sp. b19]|uniref:ATP-binding protein n=1 Tax=Kiloniella sp. GXU_MW_B19 TaxID=3141326 RepID=UPI0031D6A7E6
MSPITDWKPNVFSFFSNKSIASKLVLFSLLFGTLVSLLLSLQQFFREYHDSFATIDKNIELTRDIYSTMISEHLWQLDAHGLEKMLTDLLNIENFKHLAIVVNDQTYLEVGTREDTGTFIEKTVPLRYGTNEILGNIVIAIDKTEVRHQIYSNFIPILISNIIQTNIIVLFMIMLFYKTVLKHLIRISNYIEYMKGDLNQPFLKLVRKKRFYKDKDEMDVLVDSINSMKASLKSTMDKQRTSEQRLQSLIDVIPDIVLFSDANGRILSCNYRVEQLLNKKRSQIIGMHLSTLMPAKRAEFYLAAQKKVLSKGKKHKFEIEEFFITSGHQELLEVINAPMFSPDNKVIGIVSVGRDITERKQQEEQIRHSSKMEAIGELAGGIAHDFNNILAIVLGNLEIIEQMVPQNETVLSRIKIAQKGGARGVDIAQKLLEVSKYDDEGIGIVSINPLIRKLEDLISTSLTSSIDIRIALEDELWSVAVNPGDFEDALINLVLNARDAMPNGGCLTIRTSNETLDLGSYSPCDFVVVSVSDDGMGMTQEEQQKIFTPYFTTKSKDSGTGLGLTMVKNFIKNANGYINVASEKGNGSTFSLYLPRNRKTKQKSQRLEHNQTFAHPDNAYRETVLIVDDEEFLRDIAISFFNDLGYKTLTAENGQQALELLRQGKHADLLFSDVVMPGGIDGFQLAKIVHSEFPTVQVLLTTGYTRKLIEIYRTDDSYMKNLARKVLKKPYSKHDLYNSLQDLKSKPAIYFANPGKTDSRNAEINNSNS